MLVEFVDGLVELEISDPVEEVVTLSGEDTEGLGIEILSDLFEDFESGNGGFRVEGTALWQWGTPTSGPGAALASRIAARRLSGPASSRLVTMMANKRRLSRDSMRKRREAELKSAQGK